MEYQRLFDKSIIPTERTIASILAQNYLLWKEVHAYILSVDKVQVETKYFTKNYGWSRRFFKGSKTICYLFPETNAFSMLVVFGQKEVDRIEENKNDLKESIYNSIMETEHFHDGRWVWIRIIDISELCSVKKSLMLKRIRKMPNKACTRQVGFCGFFREFSGFEFFLLSSIIHARPLAGNANR